MVELLDTQLVIDNRKDLGGYRAKKLGVPIGIIQEKLGHRSPAVARRYIGITQEEVSSMQDKVCI